MSEYEDSFPQNPFAENVKAVEVIKRQVQSAASAVEKSVDNSGKGFAEMQLKIIEIFQTNMLAGFNFARKIALAKTVPEAMELQSAYLKSQMVASAAQAEDLREAWIGAVSHAFKPMQREAMASLQRGRIC